MAMSRFGRSGQPENRESFSILVLNVSFRKQRPSPYPTLVGFPLPRAAPFPEHRVLTAPMNHCCRHYGWRSLPALRSLRQGLRHLHPARPQVGAIVTFTSRWGLDFESFFFFLLELASSLAGLGIREGSRSWGTITRMRRGMPLTGLMVSQGKFSSVSSTFFFLNEKAGARRLIKKNRSSYNDTIHSHNRTTARRST